MTRGMISLDDIDSVWDIMWAIRFKLKQKHCVKEILVRLNPI